MAIPKRLAHHIEMCDDEGRKVIVRVADVDDYLLALVTYNAACRRCRMPTSGFGEALA
jgi:hypothetical protein